MMEWRTPAEIIALHVQHGCSEDRSVSGSGEQPNDWRLFPEVPLAAELMASQPPVLPESGDATSLVPKEEYLETQYRLHRYEATEMLRRAIVQYRQDPAMVEGENAFIYTEVCASVVLLFRVTFLLLMGLLGASPGILAPQDRSCLLYFLLNGALAEACHQVRPPHSRNPGGLVASV